MRLLETISSIVLQKGKYMCAKCETVKKLINYEWVSYIDVAESLNFSYGQCKEMFEYKFEIIEELPATPISPKITRLRMLLRMKGRC